MVNAALVRIFGLHPQGHLPPEGPLTEALLYVGLIVELEEFSKDGKLYFLLSRPDEGPKSLLALVILLDLKGQWTWFHSIFK